MSFLYAISGVMGPAYVAAIYPQDKIPTDEIANQTRSVIGR